MKTSVLTTSGGTKIGGTRCLNIFALISVLYMLSSCSSSRKATLVPMPASTNAWNVRSTVKIKDDVPAVKINTKKTEPAALVNFSLSLQGLPYKYGSMKKENGFDCSGFINYVFNHFGISVPRTTERFTNAGKEVSIRASMPGDLILFTGSDATSGRVGHMGIVVLNEKNHFQFIHASTSRGVMLSTLDSYFIPRFVKVIRVFNNGMADP